MLFDAADAHAAADTGVLAAEAVGVVAEELERPTTASSPVNVKPRNGMWIPVKYVDTGGRES